MVLPGPARLSVQTLTWLLRVEQIGELHRVLAPAAVWRPPDEVDAANAQARAEIAALGWFDRRNRLEVEVAGALSILCRAETEFYGWINRGEVTIGVLSAAIGKQALLAVRDVDRVWLKKTGHGRLAETLAAQTADVPAGQGRPVTVSRTDVFATVGGRQLTETGAGTRRASAAVRRVQHLMGLPTTGSGELYAAMRDGVGRYRISEPLRYADTSSGRYLNLTTERGQVLVAPASRADLATRLTELRRALAR